ncbi:MAG: hypothetical protein IJK40_05710, partial [Clostridia bacterium]|nr:hypothetical protein [Clostridia bacterium]
VTVEKLFPLISKRSAECAETGFNKTHNFFSFFEKNFALIFYLISKKKASVLCNIIKKQFFGNSFFGNIDFFA